jgi:LCP family protein required for cell wall assembly
LSSPYSNPPPQGHHPYPSSLSSQHRGEFSSGRSRRPAKWLRWAYASVVGLLLLTLAWIGLQWIPFSIKSKVPMLNAVVSSLPMAFPALTQEQVILVMGVDANQNLRVHHGERRVKGDLFEGARTDTMLLVRMNPAQKAISVVSLPRDSKVYLDEAGRVGKLNGAFAMGGVDFTRKIVEQAFGIPVHHYVVVNLEGVQKVVDSLGGLDLYIEKPMYYRDRTAALLVDFKPGLQHLDGKQAEAFLRFRHDALGDIGRIKRQQVFFSALKGKLGTLQGLSHLPELLKQSDTLLQTDLPKQSLLGLAAYTQQIPPGNIRLATLPGHASMREAVSYWIIDPVQATHVLNRLIFDTTEPDALNHSNEGFAPDAGAVPRKLRVAITLNPTVVGDAQLEALQTGLGKAGFEVACIQRGRYGSTQLRETSYRASTADTERLRKLVPATANVPLWFSPNGSTYEVISCSSSADYALVLGADYKP